MSACLDRLFSLSQSTLAASDVREQAQAVVRQAVERLLATAHCTPDDQEGLEDEQDHWVWEWNDRMVSPRFALYSTANTCQILMEIAANMAAELGVPATLDAALQATFAEAEGWIQKWSQDRMAHKERAAGTSRLGVPGPSAVTRSILSGVDSLPSVKIADLESRKVSNSDTPWTVLTPDTVDARAGHGEEGHGRPPHHLHPPVLKVHAARHRVCGSGARDLHRM
jgi:hypothetical protein